MACTHGKVMVPAGYCVWCELDAKDKRIAELKTALRGLMQHDGVRHTCIDMDTSDDDPCSCELCEAAWRAIHGEREWQEARAHLNSVIADYRGIGDSGLFGLTFVLQPLEERLAAGERSRDLYDAIMDTE